MKTNRVVIPVLGFLLSLAPAAEAQFATLPTNVPGIETAIAPPEGFDPLTASDTLLALYGFPPRPDRVAHAAHYESWERAMRASRKRVIPQLRQTNIFHGPKQGGNSTGTSSNWSGVVVFGGATGYNHTNSFDAIWADNTVPLVVQSPGACGAEYSSAWVGIDGYESNDVLQAGTESDTYCYTDATYAWVEWYPFPATQIVDFGVTPGDAILMEVWNTTATQGYAYLVNYSTHEYTTLSLTPPPGYSLTGNSAEWVVERPELAGGFATLPDYVFDVFHTCAAYTFSGAATYNDAYYPGSASALLLTMLDDNKNPISYPTLLGPTAIAFSATGSAFQ